MLCRNIRGKSHKPLDKSTAVWYVAAGAAARARRVKTPKGPKPSRLEPLKRPKTRAKNDRALARGYVHRRRSGGLPGDNPDVVGGSVRLVHNPHGRIGRRANPRAVD